MSTENIGDKLRKLREENELPLRKVAALIDIDVAILSKMERGERKLTKEVVQKLAKIYKHDTDELMVLYLSEKVLYEIGEEDSTPFFTSTWLMEAMAISRPSICRLATFT